MLRPFLALAALLVSLPAAAAEFDLGFVRQNMMLGQFRFGAWPAGTAIYCSDDTDRPKEVERLLAQPRQMADLGAVRCALLQSGEKGFAPAQRRIGGVLVEISATFAPDRQGAKRLVQVFLQGPVAGFDGLAAHFTARFGAPQESGERLIRWHNGKAEAVVMHEGGDTALAMLIDWPMQQWMNERLNQRR